MMPRHSTRSPEREHVAELLPLFKAKVAGQVPAGGRRLPAFVGSFVGRRRELDEVVDLLGSARLVTLTGPGGMGKTRLAVEVVERLAPGQAVFVDLAPVQDPVGVAEEIACAFGVGELGGRSLPDVLAPEVSGGALLVLDNCEHLVDACANEAEKLLQGCRELQILATSQQPLGVGGEVVWSVPGLSLPQPVPEDLGDDALESAAVRLFCERARAVQRGFDPSPSQLAAIVEICRRLDGNPLAIELAAARVAVLSPAEIAARLQDRFALLRGGTAAGPARHQTLAAALEWSDALLEEPERALLHRLSVFAGGFRLAAAEAVCAGGPVEGHDVLGLLSSLVSKSLVVADTSGTVTRYRLLETVRHYAAEGMAASEDAAELSRRHAAWCAGLVEECARADDDAWSRMGYQLEQDNVRAALDWALRTDQAELALRLAQGLMQFCEANGRFGEARDCLDRVLACTGSAPAALRAAALHDSGFAAFMLGDVEAARRHLADSLALSSRRGDPAAAERTEGLLAVVSTLVGNAGVEDVDGHVERMRATGDDARLAEALVACGHARLFRGEPEAAEAHFGELVTLARRTDDQTNLAIGLVGIGSAALGRGDYRRAEATLGEGVDLVAGSADSHAHAVGSGWLAELARLRGEADRARAEFEQCLERARSIGSPYLLAQALVGLGRVTLAGGSADEAERHFDEAAGVTRRAGLGHMLAAALDGLGQAAVAAGDVAVAQARFHDALAVARRSGDQAGVARSTYHLAELARARGALGQALSLHNEALRHRHHVGDRAGTADSLEALAGLAVARGSDEVAARLFGAAQALRDAVACARPPLGAPAYEADVAVLRQRMAPEELERAWAEGAARTAEEAVAYATRGRGPRDRPAKGPASLTPAERDIVALAAEGLTNPQIAERLFVSRRTVQSHLRNVYAKLEVRSRDELAQVLPPEA